MKQDFLFSLITLLVIVPCQGADFNEAYAASVVANIEQLVTIPWTRVNNILFSAFNSKWDYVYSGDGAVANGPDRFVQYVDTNNTIQYLWSVFKPFIYEESSSIDMVYYGFENGKFIGYTTPAPGKLVFMNDGNSSCPGWGIDIRCRKSYGGDSTDSITGGINGSVTSVKTYDPRWRPWYTGSQEGGSVWTAPYVFAGYGVLGVTAAMPLNTHSGEFIGVVGADYTLKSIENVLISLVDGYDDLLIFIVDNLGNLVAASIEGAAIDENAKQIPAINSTYPLLSGVANIVENTIGGWVAANGTIFTVEIAMKGLYWAQSNELTDEYGLHWHVVVVEEVSCEAGYYILNKEQIFSKDEKNRKVCAACPDGAECLGGDLLPFPKSGSWSDLDTSAVKLTFHTCSTQSCNGFQNNMKKYDKKLNDDINSNYNLKLELCFQINHKQNLNSSLLCNIDDLQCLKGNTGPMCGSCLKDYRFASSENTCLKCDQNPLIGLILLFVILGIIFILGILKFYNLIEIPKFIWDSWLMMIGRHLFKTGSLKVLISTYQIIQSITFSLEIKYPKSFSISLKLLDFLAFDFPGMECNGIGVYDRVYVASVTPMILAVLIIIVGEARILKTRQNVKQFESFMIKKKCNLIKSQHAWALLFLSYLVLPPITGKQFKALDCFPIKSSNLRVLRSDTLVNCDSKAHQLFEGLNSLLIIIYLSIPLIWIVLLKKEKQHLFPIGIEGDALIIQRRKMEDSLLQLKFLFERYVPNMVYFESVDMFRRILFIGVLPLMATSSLMRSAIGVGLSLFSMIGNRELSPYVDVDTNVVAYIADIVIYLTFASALMIETGLNDGVNNVLFGIVLIVVNFSVLAIALSGAIFRTKLDRDMIFQQREKTVTTVTEAAQYSAVMFEEIFASITETDNLTAHSLFFTFGTLEEITDILHHGIPAIKSRQGIVFTVLHPLDITSVEKRYFTSTDCFIVCSLPQRLLKPLPGYDHNRSAMWLLPYGALRAMRGIYFGNLADQLPWEEGKLLLPPHCIKRAFQLTKTTPNDTTTSSSSSSTNDVNCGFLCNKKSKILPSSLIVEETMRMIMDADDESFATNLEFPIPQTSLDKYLENMNKIRKHCSELNLVPIYHYTDVMAAELISKGGLMVNTEDGVHFSTFGPSNYNIGSPEYEKNIIKDFYGPDRVEEFINKNRFEVCLVFGIDPLVVEMSATNSSSSARSSGYNNGESMQLHHLVHIPKQYFIDLSMEHPSGRYFLHPHRLIGAFRLDPHMTMNGLLNNKDELTLQSIKDLESTTLIQQFISEKETNEELMKSVMKELAPCMKVEWAVTHNASKFKSIFDMMYVPSTHVLLFHYGSLAEISSYVLSGIPVKKHIDNGNLIFTSHLFNELTSYEKELFENCEGFIACSLLRDSLVTMVVPQDQKEASKSQLYTLPSAILRTMRGTYFKNMINTQPWNDGMLLLPPSSFKHVFQIVDNEHIKNKKTIEISSSSTHVTDTIPNSPIPFITRTEIISKISTITDYHLKFNLLKKRCLESGLIPVYYYTSIEETSLILEKGFKMKNGNIGFLSSMDGALTSGGVNFSLLEPSFFGLFQKNQNLNDYEKKVIQNFIGPENNEDNEDDIVQLYIKNKTVDVCIVYAINPLVLSHVENKIDENDDDEKKKDDLQKNVLVRKELFHDFCLPSKDGCYYLRPDYIIGAYLFDTNNGNDDVEMITPDINSNEFSLKHKKRSSILFDKGSSPSMVKKMNASTSGNNKSLSSPVLEGDVLLETLEG